MGDGAGPRRSVRPSPGRKTDSQRRTGRVYEGAFESVFAILIGAGFGYWADSVFETSPRYLLLGLAIGFGAFVLRLWKLGLALQKMADGEMEESSDER
jgi:F0F1-type ATP synthase assembly protein I